MASRPLLMEEPFENRLARAFHETYERLAPHYSYTTRPESATTWEDVPDRNKALMIATCRELVDELKQHLSDAVKGPFQQLLDEAEARHDDFSALVFSGELEAASVIPPAHRDKGCPKCGAGAPSGLGGFTVAFGCVAGDECPLGRPPYGVTIAEAMGLKTP